MLGIFDQVKIATTLQPDRHHLSLSGANGEVLAKRGQATARKPDPICRPRSCFRHCCIWYCVFHRGRRFASLHQNALISCSLCFTAESTVPINVTEMKTDMRLGSSVLSTGPNSTVLVSFLICSLFTMFCFALE